MNRYSIIKVVSFFIYLLAQSLIFNNIILFGTAHAFIYLGFFLTLPIEMAIIPGMFIGLAMGLGMDAFSNTFGIHAAASVLLMYLRPVMLSGVRPHGGYPNGAIPRPNSLGVGWFATYSLPLIFIHHAVVFFIEFGGFSLFWPTLFKVFTSTVYSFLLITIIQYLFVTKDKK